MEDQDNSFEEPPREVQNRWEQDDEDDDVEEWKPIEIKTKKKPICINQNVWSQNWKKDWKIKMGLHGRISEFKQIFTKEEQIEKAREEQREEEEIEQEERDEDNEDQEDNGEGEVRNYPYYLFKVFKLLQKKKGLPVKKQIHIGTVYPGFKTIPIQKLQRKNIFKDPPTDGSILYENENIEIKCYRQSCPFSFESWNGFFDAILSAYLNHGDLKLTPDDVWLSIMLYFSNYVDDNAEQLRAAFVQHQGKKKLTIITASWDQSDWDEFFSGMIKRVREQTVQGITRNFECDFSSTTNFSLSMSTAIIMNSFKKFFDYQRQGGICGIVNIHMGGVLKDWQNLQKKLYFLRQFDVDGKLKSYVDGLMPVLEQFTQTYKGHAHIQFWNNLYHERVEPEKQGYPTPQNTFANGWLFNFFNNDSDLIGAFQAKVEEINVPIHFINPFLKIQKDFQMKGGCKGVSVESGTVYRPHYSYAIIEDLRKKTNTESVSPFQIQKYLNELKAKRELPVQNARKRLNTTSAYYLTEFKLPNIDSKQL